MPTNSHEQHAYIQRGSRASEHRVWPRSPQCITTKPKRKLMTHKTTRQADHAPIVHRSDKDICFRVDEVTPSERRLSVTDARQQFEKRMGRSLQAFTHDASIDIVGGQT